LGQILDSQTSESERSCE